jgi:hypothetical protein
MQKPRYGFNVNEIGRGDQARFLRYVGHVFLLRFDEGPDFTTVLACTVATCISENYWDCYRTIAAAVLWTELAFQMLHPPRCHNKERSITQHIMTRN